VKVLIKATKENSNRECEIWGLRENDQNGILISEMRYLRHVDEVTLLDKKLNEHVREKLNTWLTE
jgi:hypothetical protein